MTSLNTRIKARFGNTAAQALIAVAQVEKASSRVDYYRASLLEEEQIAIEVTNRAGEFLAGIADGITAEQTAADAARAAELTAFDDRTGQQIKALMERLRQLEIRRATARTKLTSSQEADRTAAKLELEAISLALGVVGIEMANLVEQQTADSAIADSFGFDAE